MGKEGGKCKFLLFSMTSEWHACKYVEIGVCLDSLFLRIVPCLIPPQPQIPAPSHSLLFSPLSPFFLHHRPSTSFTTPYIFLSSSPDNVVAERPGKHGEIREWDRELGAIPNRTHSPRGQRSGFDARAVDMSAGPPIGQD